MKRLLPRDAYQQQFGQVAEATPSLRKAISTAKARGDVVLDVGCGEGQTLELIRRAAPEVRLVGIDLSHGRVSIAAGRGHRVVLGDATRLPVPSDGAGLVICRHVIEHVDDDAALLGELRRIMHPGGMLYLETPLRLRGAWYPYRDSSGRHVLDPTHVREYTTVREVDVLVRGAGLVPRENEVVPIAYAAGHVLARAMHRLGWNGTAAARVSSTLGFRVRIPRYREIRLLAVKE